MSPVRLYVAQYASFSNLALPELPHTARVHVFGSDQIRAGTDDTAAASGLVTDPSGLKTNVSARPTTIRPHRLRTFTSSSALPYNFLTHPGIFWSRCRYVPSLGRCRRVCVNRRLLLPDADRYPAKNWLCAQLARARAFRGDAGSGRCRTRRQVIPLLFPYAFLILSLRPLGYDRLLIPGPKQQAGIFREAPPCSWRIRYRCHVCN